MLTSWNKTEGCSFYLNVLKNFIYNYICLQKFWSHMHLFLNRIITFTYFILKSLSGFMYLKEFYLNCQNYKHKYSSNNFVFFFKKKYLFWSFADYTKLWNSTNTHICFVSFPLDVSYTVTESSSQQESSAGALLQAKLSAPLWSCVSPTTVPFYLRTPSYTPLSRFHLLCE